jgi:hypothetical protein
MSEASDKLNRTRQAILEHVARRERRHDPREEPPQGYETAASWPPPDANDMDFGSGWFGHLKHAVGTWWRYHPAHMAVDLATPLMRNYARRKPGQLILIGLGVGAALTFARPWRLISIGTLLVALLKSSQLSSLFMAAMSAADYRKDASRPPY